MQDCTLICVDQDAIGYCYAALQPFAKTPSECKKISDSNIASYLLHRTVLCVVSLPVHFNRVSPA